MALNFSANQFDQAYQAERLQNWELSRFYPPRPRLLDVSKAKPICDNNGHLLPTARRDGNSFGQFRSTWQLPDCITRNFVDHYHACLVGRHKFRNYPRDSCPCHHEKTHKHKCDQRTILGVADDPYWAKPKCQTKCQSWAIVRDWNKPRKTKRCPGQEPHKVSSVRSLKKKKSRRKQKKVIPVRDDGLTERQHQLQQFKLKAIARVQQMKQSAKDRVKAKQQMIDRLERLAAKEAKLFEAKLNKVRHEPAKKDSKKVVKKASHTKKDKKVKTTSSEN